MPSEPAHAGCHRAEAQITFNLRQELWGFFFVRCDAGLSANEKIHAPYNSGGVCTGLQHENAPAADVKTVYADNCAKRPGDDGKGQTRMGQKTGARDYSDPNVQDSFTVEQGFKSVKEGLKEDDQNLMKPYALSDDDIKAVIAYMLTLKK
jgi:Cytochrome c